MLCETSSNFQSFGNCVLIDYLIDCVRFPLLPSPFSGQSNSLPLQKWRCHQIDAGRKRFRKMWKWKEFENDDWRKKHELRQDFENDQRKHSSWIIFSWIFFMHKLARAQFESLEKYENIFQKVTNSPFFLWPKDLLCFAIGSLRRRNEVVFKVVFML